MNKNFSSLLESEAFRALNPEYAQFFRTVVKTLSGISALVTQLASGTGTAQAALSAENIAKRAEDVDAIELLKALLAAQETTGAREKAASATQQERAITLNKVLEYMQHNTGDDLAWGYIFAAHDSIVFEQRSKEIEAEITEAKKLAKKYDVTEYGILPKRVVD